MKTFHVIFFLIIVFCMSFSTASAIVSAPFGGLVLSPYVPGVECAGGVGPIVLATNIMALGDIGREGSGVGGALSSVYQAIPFYLPPGVSSNKPTPRFGGFIKGNYSHIPNVYSCYASWAGGFPFPVKNIYLYGSTTATPFGF